MHANTLLVAGMASAAAAVQIDVVHVLEKFQVMPAPAHHVAARALNARQDGSEASCEAAFSTIVKDMPTLPSELLDYAETAQTTNACTQVLPLSLSAPLLEAVTAFARWGVENSQSAMEWAAACDDDMDQLNNLMSPGDIFLLECRSGTPALVFTEGSTTQTLDMNSVILGLQQDILGSLTYGDGSSPSTTGGGSEASETAASTTGGTESTGASGTTSESPSGSSGAAAEGNGDNGSGASSVVASAAALGLVALAGFFITI